MTDTLSRPVRSGPARSTRAGPAEPGRHPLYAGVLAAGWAAGAGLIMLALPVLLVWLTDARSGASAPEALRSAGQVWLVAHGVSLRIPGGTFGLTPLGLLAVPLLLLVRAAGHAAREARPARLSEAGRLVAAIAVPYGLVAAVVAGATRGSSVQAVSWQALVGGSVVGAIGALLGVLRATRLHLALLALVPDRARPLLAPLAATLAVLVGCGAVLAGSALLVHLPRAADLARSSTPGLAGGLALVLLGLALVPNAVVWSLAWLTGPGFALGVGTSVGPFAHHLGAVPAVPLLAAVPGPVSGWVGGLGLLLPVAAGCLGGWLLVRRQPGRPLGATVREAALLGPSTGLVVGVACWFSAGPLGGARFVAVGPSPWQVGAAVTAEVALGAAATALLLLRLRPRD